MTSIRIGYCDIPIEIKDIDDKDCFGYFEFYPKPLIAISHRLDLFYRSATVLHEILEAISAIYGLDLSEGQVRTLETVLVALAQGYPEEAGEFIRSLGDQRPIPHHSEV